MCIYEELFPLRLAKLRAIKGVSARDMSLSLGQNAGYINNIENGKALPSMSNFFYICEYLNISPMAFFDMNSEDPQKLQQLFRKLQNLDHKQLSSLEVLVDGIINNKWDDLKIFEILIEWLSYGFATVERKCLLFVIVFCRAIFCLHKICLRQTI